VKHWFQKSLTMTIEKQKRNILTNDLNSDNSNSLDLSFEDFTLRYKDVFEKELLSYITSNQSDKRKILEEAMTYSLMAKGKRFRPMLVIATFLMFSSDIKKIMPLACAIEMSHTYSLIHDDLPAMDNDDFRRGALTCHKKFGEDVAILAGDTLNTYAYEILSSNLTYESKKILNVIVEFSKAQGIDGMAGGQMLDLAGHSLQKKASHHLETTHRLKTGKIIESCIILPAILENAPDGVKQLLKEFGQIVGLLFQITDDILDVVGTSKELGKTSNKDVEQNKLTYVTYYGLDESKRMASNLVMKGQEIADKLNNKVYRDIMSFMIKRTF